MPERLVLADVAHSVFDARGNDLAYQFLEGVQFMHQQNVAHLDLKPENILLTATSPQQLLLTDFGVSVQVPHQESWIEGYRGTEGYAAPELDDDPNPKYQPIRADLWSAGRVLQYFAGRQCAGTIFVFKSLANELMMRDPLQRPLLSNTRLISHLYYQGSQTLKRKLDAYAQVKETGKRKREQYVSPVA